MKFASVKDKFTKETIGVHPRTLLFLLVSALIGMATPFTEPQSAFWMIGLIAVLVSGTTMFYVLYKVLADDTGKLFSDI